MAGRASVIIILLTGVCLSLIPLISIPAQEGTAEPAFLSGHERAVWVSVRSSSLFKAPSGAADRKVGLGDGFEVLSENKGWLKVSGDSGATGWLKKSETSSTWILIEKGKKKLTHFDLRTVRGKWGADFGGHPEGDKVKSGDHRTPEGEFYVCRKVPNSQFYKAFLISYPGIKHAEAGLKQGLISRSDHDAIIRAIKSKGTPPQDTPLGGLIEIHGRGTGGLYNWTLGCIGMPDSAMDAMWNSMQVGTPIVIVP